MSRRSAFRALAGSAVLATGVMLVAACGPASVPGAATLSNTPASRLLRGPDPAPHFTGLVFPDATDGWLLGESGGNTGLVVPMVAGARRRNSCSPGTPRCISGGRSVLRLL